MERIGTWGLRAAITLLATKKIAYESRLTTLRQLRPTRNPARAATHTRT